MYTNNLIYVTPQGEETTTTLTDLCKTHKYTALYFYPKDNTPGCTIEARDFTALQKDFLGVDAQIIGVSKDSVKSHCGFQTKQELSIGLISDTDTTLAQYFDVWAEKKFMGRTYMGMNRNTYLLDKTGSIVYKREKVSSVGHAQAVLDYIKTNI